MSKKIYIAIPENKNLCWDSQRGWSFAYVLDESAIPEEARRVTSTEIRIKEGYTKRWSGEWYLEGCTDPEDCWTNYFSSEPDENGIYWR